MREALLVVALSAGAGLAGAALGSRGFDRTWDSQQLCATCHDDMELHQPGHVPPHHPDLMGHWHGLEHFDQRAWAEHLFGSVGLEANAFVGEPAQRADPAAACMGCHLPGSDDDPIPCVMCHGGDDLTWVHSDVIVGPHRCDTCHEDQKPMGPHAHQGCQDCHLEVVGNPRKKAKMLLVNRIREERGGAGAPSMGGNP